MYYSLCEAKAKLSQLLDEVEAGKEVIITRRNRPVTRLERIVDRRPRHLGQWRGKYPPIPDEAFRPMSDAELDEFLGTTPCE